MRKVCSAGCAESGSENLRELYLEKYLVNLKDNVNSLHFK